MNLALSSMHGLIATLILLGVSSSVLFKYVPTPSTYQTKTNPTSYFVRFFFTIAFAFLSYTLKAILPEGLAVLITHNLYLLGMYFLIIGLQSRQAPEHKIISNKFIFIHLLLLSIINVGIFFFYIPNTVIRTLSLNINLIILMIYSLSCVHKDNITFERGENVFKVVLWISIGITLVSPIMLMISQNIETYFSYSVMLQSVQMHIIFGGLCVLILSDVIDLHYKNSVTDAMTGMYNRRYFMQKSDAILAKCHENNLSPRGSLIICDIDNFKRINDSYGHDTGDKVIIQFGHLLRKMVRENDILARVGGEEFAIFLPHTSLDTAKTIAERIRKCTEVMKLTSRTEGEIEYTASFGVASLTDATKISVLLRAADSAMYCAKDAGRNQVCVFQGTTFIDTLPKFTGISS